MTEPKFPKIDTGRPFRVENDTTSGYWSHTPQNTLPPPDMMGAYMRNRPVPPASDQGRKAWIIGSGIAGLAAAFYLIRDGGIKGEDITILDAMQVEGGSLDGAGNPEDGYIIRGGREMNWNYDKNGSFLSKILELDESSRLFHERVAMARRSTLIDVQEPRSYRFSGAARTLSRPHTIVPMPRPIRIVSTAKSIQ